MFNVLVHEYTDYRAFLRAALDERVKKNSSFSLRSFARFSSVSPSYLSRVLSGQRGLSIDSANSIARALDLSPEETTYFVNLIELGDAKDPTQKLKVEQKVVKHRAKAKTIVEDDSFQAIADWYHFALLELVRTSDFRANAQWIAERLKIKPIEAKSAFERLLRLGLIEKQNGKYAVVNDANIETPHDQLSLAVQQNHRQHLKMAADALAELAPELREFANMTMSMNIENIPKAKKRIRNFLDSFSAEMAREGGQELLQMNLQFYVLTKKAKDTP